MVRNLYPCLLISKTGICVVYVYDFLFWEIPQSDIYKFMKSFNEDCTSYSLEHSKVDSVSEL